MSNTTTAAAKTVNPLVAFKRLTEKRANLLADVAKIDAELEKYAGLKEQAEKDAKFRATIEAGLPVGTKVTYEFGRGATRITKIGEVRAFKAAAEKVPAQYRITSGEGFDEVIDTVPAAAIVDYEGSPELNAPADTEAAVSATPADTTANPADPFAGVL